MRDAMVFVLAAAWLALSGIAGADTVHLLNGKTVEGKIVKVGEDKLTIRTATGDADYTRDEVKYFSVEQVGPDGKPVTKDLAFKLKPVQMPHELATEHYVIKTDTADFVCKNAAHAMEELYKAYTDIFDIKAEPQKQKTDIVIFEKKEDFTKYAATLKATIRDDTLGFYRTGSDGTSQIVTYKRQTDEFNTLSTMYHEATHQFIMMVMGGSQNAPPLWVNEGLAVYFENSRWQKNVLQTGIIPRQRLLFLQNAIRSGKMIPLAELFKRGKDTYDGLCYSEGWSVIYFFVKANRGAYAKEFGKYLRMLREHKDPDEAFKTCFTADVNALEQAWKKFVMELKAPAK